MATVMSYYTCRCGTRSTRCPAAAPARGGTRSGSRGLTLRAGNNYRAR